MVSHRWTTHRVRDAAGNDRVGEAPISMWWIAHAAAEETLQGGPLVPAWLKLFRTHLSQNDQYAFRWRGDLAESSELRRAYSGLYGRFVARALLTNHLGLSRFTSLKRNGISLPNGVEVSRIKGGDIPDWIAWDESNRRYVLCEAKGSLTSADFLSTSGPKCVLDGKAQFSRVITTDNARLIHPSQWVAGTKWATDVRGGGPITILWDPPVDDDFNDGDKVQRYRAGITRAWLDSIARGFGWQGADELISPERQREALIINAPPGPLRPEQEWPSEPDVDERRPEYPMALGPRAAAPRSSLAGAPSDVERVVSRVTNPLRELDLYKGSTPLVPAEPESHPLQGSYVAALVTPFGIQPIKSVRDLEQLRRAQDGARALREPAMILGIPTGLDPAQPISRKLWMDSAGIAPPNGLALFDLRQVQVELFAQS